MVEVGDAERIAEDEDWGVVADDVPLAFLGVELDRETADIALGVGRAALAGDGGEAGEEQRLFADPVEDFFLVKRVMSWVTVKVPWAPQPLACMRRSGITSRSKCAIFAASQMSSSSAGRRRPAS